jgi:hypothetical protein
MSSKSRKPKESIWTTIKMVLSLPRAFLVGSAFGALVFAVGIIFASLWIWPGMISKLLPANLVAKFEANNQSALARNHIPNPFYITIYNGKKLRESDEDHGPQTFKVTIKGSRSYQGELIDIAYPENKGTITGHWRANALVFEYASNSEEGFGYGTIILREDTPARANQASTYEGFAIVHQCECEGKNFHTGPMEMVTAVLTPGPTVPSELAEKYLFAREPLRIDTLYFPPTNADVLHKASAN